MRRRNPTTLRVVLLAVCLAALAPAAAARADITVDPGGPAGKQYSAVDDRARQQASGAEGSAGVPGSGEKAPLFGQGAGNGDGGGDGGASGGTGGGDLSPATTTGDSSSSGGGQEMAIGAAVLAVLAGAGLLVVVMRRGARLST